MAKTLGVLVYENCQPIDFIAPWEVFSLWKTIAEPINLYLISQDGGYVSCVNDILIKTHCDFERSPQLDYLIIPGGKGRINEVNNAKLISFIQKQAQNAQYILSICTGMFLLHKAGLLHDKLVTTYWRAMPEARLLSNVQVTEERMVKNGNIWLAAGVSSGIDLAFEFIAEIDGKEAAGKVQLLYENFPLNHAYCTANMAHSLPPYNDKEENSLHLPRYILEYIEKYAPEVNSLD
ncbi:DJ-1/PfpI family protein [Legionella sp. 29fVS95]|uniref:DJ-1/PfpI family protein n=1 Tax=Legionella sp. 29fVS95 TaxID=3402813 RepID=UPI003AF899F2